jgi:hypothetical protein
MPRGVAPIKHLTEIGLNVASGQDSIADPFYPVGEGNMLRILDVGLHVAHMLSCRHLARALDFITHNGAKNLGITDRYGMAEGKPANCILLDCDSDQQAVRHQPDVLCSIHNGKDCLHPAAGDLHEGYRRIRGGGRRRAEADGPPAGRCPMTERHDGQTLVILGASGDLTRRLLLPGLGGLLAAGGGGHLELVGSARRDWDDRGWRALVADSFAAGGASGERVDAVARSARFVGADVTSEDDLRRLLDGCTGRPILYCALSPQITMAACEALTRVGLPEGARMVLEKPFGTAADSATALNELLARLLPEDQVYRVDHFLGLSTVLNIFGLRFANRLLEPMRNAEHVESVAVVFDESLALEGRAGYYDSAGALVDMIQSHGCWCCRCSPWRHPAP